MQLLKLFIVLQMFVSHFISRKCDGVDLNGDNEIFLELYPPCAVRTEYGKVGVNGTRYKVDARCGP